MIDPSHQAFQDIQQLDKFLTQCNLQCKDPYVSDDFPSHSDAITARRSITNVDEYFRQLGFLNLPSKRLRAIIDHAEGEDWSRVSQCVKDANNEFMTINRAYEDSMRLQEPEDMYSQLTHEQEEHQRSNRMITRLSQIDEAPSRLTVDSLIMSPQTIQYIQATHSERDQHNASKISIVESQSRQQDMIDIYSQRGDHQPGHQTMDEDLRLQLHLPLENLDQSDAKQESVVDPETTITERLEQIEDTKRRGELASKAMHENNPNVADLSDVNRPSKVAERFSRLYDDLWTGACEELTQQYQAEYDGEKQAILDLAEILRAAFEFTAKYVDTQAERIAHQIREMMLDPCIDSKQESTTDPFRHDKILGRYAGHCIKEAADLSVPALQKNFISHAFPRKLVKISKLSTIKIYTDTCIELTWLMNVQDPPMVLLWPGMVSTENIVGYFRYCTATGTVLDHEVWPAVSLYKDGPVIYKGVAQFKASMVK